VLKIIILGGQGFLGKNLIEALYTDNEVIALDIYECVERRVDGCKYYRYDFTEIDAWEHLLKNTDILYHLAGSTNPLTSSQDIPGEIESNILGTVRMLEAVVKHGVKKLVFPSSGGTVYGEALYTPIDEKHPTNPVSSYGAAKLAIEKYIQVFNRMHGLDYCILRFANVYGRYQNSETQGAINIFIRKLLSDETIKIWGNGTAVRDYINVRDAVDALILAGREDHQAKLFNVGSNKGFSVNEIIGEIADCMNKTARVDYIDARPYDVNSNVLDCSLIKSVYGFDPKVSLRQGISSILNSM